MVFFCPLRSPPASLTALFKCDSSPIHPTADFRYSISLLSAEDTAKPLALGLHGQQSDIFSNRRNKRSAETVGNRLGTKNIEMPACSCLLQHDPQFGTSNPVRFTDRLNNNRQFLPPSNQRETERL